MLILRRFSLLAVCALAVIVACVLVVWSGRVAAASSTFRADLSPRVVSGPPVEPELPPGAPSVPEQQSPEPTGSGDLNEATSGDVSRRVEDSFSEEFSGQAALEFDRGDSLLGAGDLNGAILAYMAAEELYGQPSAALQNMIGKVYEAYGNHESAVGRFTNAVAIVDHPVLRVNRASSLLELRQCSAAVEDAEWLLETDDSPLPDSSTHFAAHFVMVRCHEPDLSRAGWDPVNREPVFDFGRDDEDIVEVSPCHSSFKYHWSGVAFPFVISDGSRDLGSVSPCANGWLDDDDKAKFNEHTQAALKMAEDGDFSDGMVAYFRQAASAHLSLRGVPPESTEPESCIRSDPTLRSEATDEQRAREHLNEARLLLGLPPLMATAVYQRPQDQRPQDQRVYDVRTLELIIEAACRGRLDPRYIADLQRRLDALGGSQ